MSNILFFKFTFLGWAAKNTDAWQWWWEDIFLSVVFACSQTPESKKWLRFWIVPDAKSNGCPISRETLFAPSVTWFLERPVFVLSQNDIVWIIALYMSPTNGQGNASPDSLLENAHFKLVRFLGKNFERPIGFVIFKKECWALRMRKI